MEITDFSVNLCHILNGGENKTKILPPVCNSLGYVIHNEGGGSQHS